MFPWEGFPRAEDNGAGFCFAFGLVGELLRFSYPLFLQLEGSF